MSPDPLDVVIALGPAFGEAITRTIGGIPHAEVLSALAGGVEAEGLKPRLVKVYHTSDCGAIGHCGSGLSGSGIAVGLQSKGTTLIHRRGLPPLDNLELFAQAPLLTLDSYHVIGRNAARYARNEPVSPVPVNVDNTARLRLIIKTTLLHSLETRCIDAGRRPTEVSLADQPVIHPRTPV